VLHETVISSAGFYVCAMLREVWDEGFLPLRGALGNSLVQVFGSYCALPYVIFRSVGQLIHPRVTHVLYNMSYISILIYILTYIYKLK
jgi:hypothetical protein